LGAALGTERPDRPAPPRRRLGAALIQHRPGPPGRDLPPGRHRSDDVRRTRDRLARRRRRPRPPGRIHPPLDPADTFARRLRCHRGRTPRWRRRRWPGFHQLPVARDGLPVKNAPTETDHREGNDDVSDVKERLKKVMVASLELKRDPDTIPEKDIVDTLGLDSINTLEFLIWVENEFNIEIADEDLSVRLVDDLDVLSAYVSERLSG